MKLAVTRILAATASALFLTAMAASCGDNNKGGSSTPSKEEQSYDFGGMKITFADTWGKDLTPARTRLPTRLLPKSIRLSRNTTSISNGSRSIPAPTGTTWRASS